jgi:hypothetical protein
MPLAARKAAPGWNATKQAITAAQKYAPAESPVQDLDLAFTLEISVQGGMETCPCRILWLFVAVISYRLYGRAKAFQVPAKATWSIGTRRDQRRMAKH